MGRDFNYYPSGRIGFYGRIRLYHSTDAKDNAIETGCKSNIVGDTASIAAMETVEISLALMIPGFMHAVLTDALFWLGLGIILPAGYAVAYPAMYWAMMREQKKGSIQTHHH